MESALDCPTEEVSRLSMELIEDIKFISSLLGMLIIKVTINEIGWLIPILFNHQALLDTYVTQSITKTNYRHLQALIDVLGYMVIG